MSWEFCLIVGIQYPEWDLRPRNKQDMSKLFVKLFVQGSLVTKKNISKAAAQADSFGFPKSEARPKLAVTLALARPNQVWLGLAHGLKPG